MRIFTKKEIIPGLFDDIWAEEASGILNHAIEGFQQLKQRNRFNEPKDCVEARNVWIVRSNELITFIDELCLQGPEYSQTLPEFYNNFKDHCEDAGVKNIPTRKGIKDRADSTGKCII